MIKNEQDLDKIVKGFDEAVKSDMLVQYAQKHKIDKDKTLKKLSSEVGKITYGDTIRGMNNEELAEALVSIHELLETYKEMHKNCNSEHLVRYIKDYLDDECDFN